ncbi:MAG TPA: DNA-protecting protein DprA, partial [Stenotrophomonas sp.]|nr:DNA-protecting protein DprA [Stenotrophomonas sp.]
MPIPCLAASTALLTLVLAGGALPPRLRLLRQFSDAAAALR